MPQTGSLGEWKNDIVFYTAEGAIKKTRGEPLELSMPC